MDQSVARNPFLPKSSIRWRVGQARGTVGIPALPAESTTNVTSVGDSRIVYRKDPRGRKAKKKVQASETRSPASVDLLSTDNVAQTYPYSGKLDSCTDAFFCESSAGWGSNLDIFGLAHGPAGCGSFSQTARLNLPEFIQGIESFTALHACTDLGGSDLKDAGDAKLEQAVDEVERLFPLARGTAILCQNSISFRDENTKGIAKSKSKQLGKPIISMPCNSNRTAESAAVRGGAILGHGAAA